VYAKSLVVVALCTIFVLAFYLVLSYEAAGIGNQSVTVPTTTTSCPASATSCDTLAITAPALHVVNYTDELGTVNYATLSFDLEPSGGSTISTLNVFIGNMSAGSVQGPFQPGSSRMENLTLPSTVSVYSGETYVLTVEGSYGNGQTAWTSTKVTAA